jgi:hypothetical protein
MVEPTSIAAIVISSLTTLAGVVAGFHIKRMNSGCCEIDCFKTPPSSPKFTSPKQVIALQP